MEVSLLTLVQATKGRWTGHRGFPAVMAELRPGKHLPRMSHPSENKALLDERYRKHPPPKTVRPTRTLHITISLFILLSFVLYAQRKGVKPKTPYGVGGTSLPEWYGICSKDGKKVYTVPEGGGLGAVECVVVGGKEVVDTGSLGL